MSAPQIEFAFPVDWPRGRPKTPRRKEALFRSDGRRITFDTALRRLREQVTLVTPNGRDWRILEQTLSTNFELRSDGRPRRDRGVPADPSVASSDRRSKSTSRDICWACWKCVSC